MSGIVLRKGTRVLTEDEIKGTAGGRAFVDVMNMDMFETRREHAKTAQTHGFYTIGVVSDITPPISGKSGKKFTILKLTDLVKYDLTKVQNQLSHHLEPLIQK
jgi:hypothetical protein